MTCKALSFLVALCAASAATAAPAPLTDAGVSALAHRFEGELPCRAPAKTNLWCAASRIGTAARFGVPEGRHTYLGYSVEVGRASLAETLRTPTLIVAAVRNEGLLVAPLPPQGEAETAKLPRIRASVSAVFAGKASMAEVSAYYRLFLQGFAQNAVHAYRRGASGDVAVGSARLYEVKADASSDGKRDVDAYVLVEPLAPGVRVSVIPLVPVVSFPEETTILDTLDALAPEDDRSAKVDACISSCFSRERARIAATKRATPSAAESQRFADERAACAQACLPAPPR